MNLLLVHLLTKRFWQLSVVLYHVYLLASLYPGDPTEYGLSPLPIPELAALVFLLPDFNVVVPANGCSLLTQDQVNFVAGVDGLIAPGQTLNIDINVPSAQVVIPTLTYDPANGCIPGRGVLS